MLPNKAFEIQFSGLSEGKHEFTFDINENFFVENMPEDLISCALTANVELTKSSNMLVLDTKLEGNMLFPCDRCLEDLQLGVDSTNRLFVKFGPENNEEAEDVLVLSNNAYKLNISQHFYEYIMLAVPQKKSHPIEDCNQEAVRKLNELSVYEKSEDEVDPRWNKLNELKQ